MISHIELVTGTSSAQTVIVTLISKIMYANTLAQYLAFWHRVNSFTTLKIMIFQKGLVVGFFCEPRKEGQRNTFPSDGMAFLQ